MSNETYSKIAERIRSLMNSKDQLSKKVVTWEDEFGKNLRSEADKEGVPFSMEKGEDKEGNLKVTYTKGEESLELIRHLDNFNVGEKSGTFYFELPKDYVWGEFGWFEDEFEKNPVELHGWRQAKNGEVEEYIIYS